MSKALNRLPKVGEIVQINPAWIDSIKGNAIELAIDPEWYRNKSIKIETVVARTENTYRAEGPFIDGPYMYDTRSVEKAYVDLYPEGVEINQARLTNIPALILLDTKEKEGNYCNCKNQY